MLVSLCVPADIAVAALRDVELLPPCAELGDAVEVVMLLPGALRFFDDVERGAVPASLLREKLDIPGILSFEVPAELTLAVAVPPTVLDDRRVLTPTSFSVSPAGV